MKDQAQAYVIQRKVLYSKTNSVLKLRPDCIQDIGAVRVVNFPSLVRLCLIACPKLKLVPPYKDGWNLRGESYISWWKEFDKGMCLAGGYTSAEYLYSIQPCIILRPLWPFFRQASAFAKLKERGYIHAV